MRLFKYNMLVLALIVLSASIASAYTVRLEENSGNFDAALAGDVLTVDVFVDRDGVADNLVSIGVGVQTDNAVLNYDGQIAVIVGDPIAVPNAIFTDGGTFTWLLQTTAYGTVSPASDPGTSRVTVDYNATNANGTGAPGENVLMATLQYTVQPGQGGNVRGAFDFDFFSTGGFFISDGGGGSIKIDDQVTVINNVNVVPEPTTALLVGMGLVGLGVAGRRRA